MGAEGLVKFNQEFSLLAASAVPLMGEWAVKEQYFAMVSSRVGASLRTRADEPLQKVMATALDLEYEMKQAALARRAATGGNFGGVSGGDLGRP